jgi:hypothetical protein
MSVDAIVAIAEHAPLTLSSATYWNELKKRAQQQRRDGESSEMCTARYAASSAEGKILMAAYQKAKRANFQPRAIAKGDSSTSHALLSLQKLANEYCKIHPEITRAQAMAKVLNSPEGASLYQTERAERLAKCLPYG